ncbi:hypothetical protein B484DRAFT_448254 [Ochromonadaceae sp. CCMP2298]|nr:hypothetical protein B484DRAFT_448254 [Ochromonadaceae sp. CCMP2298]
MNPKRSHGHASHGHSSIGHGSHIGHSSIGHSSIGHGSHIGHSSIGHSSIGHSSIGHSSIGHSNIGHSSIGHSSIGHSSHGHSSIGHSSHGHSSFGHISGHVAGNGSHQDFGSPFNIVASAILGTVALIFFFLGGGFFLSSNGEEWALKSIPWAVVSGGYDAGNDEYYGLKYHIIPSGIYSYSSCEGFVICSECLDSGHSAFNLLIAAFSFSIVLAVGSCSRCCSKSKELYYAVSAAGLFGCLFGIIGLSVFSQCTDAIQDGSDGVYSQGTAATYVIVATLLSFFAAVSNAYAPVVDGGTPNPSDVDGGTPNPSDVGGGTPNPSDSTSSPTCAPVQVPLQILPVQIYPTSVPVQEVQVLALPASTYEVGGTSDVGGASQVGDW